MRIAAIAISLRSFALLFSSLLAVPIFKEALTKFLVRISVSDDLQNVRLHIRAVEPENEVSGKLSFKANDENFIGKKLKHVEISASK